MGENPRSNSPVGANPASSRTEPTSATSASPEGAKTGVRHGRRGQRKKSYLPLELRLRLYDEVLKLRGQRLSYNDIIERVRKSSGVRLGKSHTSYWTRGEHRPLGRVNEFDAKPSPELCYIIGTILSDGTLNLHSDHHYGVSLRGVKDFEYAYEFSRCLAKVLGRRKPYRPSWSRSRRYWIVEGPSILLFKELSRPWQMLKPYIEANKTCVAAFFRAFFDGEGSMHRRQLTAYNTDKQLLVYIKEQLKRYFDVDTTGPHLSQKSGTVMHCPRTGKTYRTNKDCYRIYIRTHGLPRFHKDIGFTIERKQRRLAEAAKQ